MSRLRRLLVLHPIGLLGLLVGVWLFLAGLAWAPLTANSTVLYHIEPIGEIRGSQSVGQTVRVPYDGFYSIDVFLADYGRHNTGPVTIRLLTAPGGQVLAEHAFLAESIRGDVMYNFSFPAIPDSAGQQYYFELSAPEAQEGNSLTAYLQPSAPFLAGEAYWSGQPIQGDLVFVLSFRVSPWTRARIFLEQASAGKPGLWGQAWFYVALLAAYMAASAVVLVGLRSASDA